VVKKRGNATDILSRKKPGETVDVIGPLGNSFKDPEAGRSALLLAGGIGLGPMLFFASHLEMRNQSYTLVFGCRNGSAIPQCEDLRELGAVLCTDDGSMGFSGTTVDYLTSLYPNHMKGENTELYCCGPHAMLSAASRFAHEKGIPCWVSMEQTMGCSMGACMGCVIPLSRKPGFARVCTEGPIFNSEEVSWT
jgi:dihydroorotate dehydrogenase electron transfer subunit